MKGKRILGSGDIARIIDDYSKKIFQETPDLENFAIIGVQTRGVTLAERIRKNLENLSGRSIRTGILDITFYRDDLSTRGILPVIKETKIGFDISEMSILLVDDVIFTGRTTKAALESLMSFGRPQAIKLFVLIDRGNRELPLQPDYCGFKIATRVDDAVRVCLGETDGEEDGVYLQESEFSPERPASS